MKKIKKTSLKNLIKLSKHFQLNTLFNTKNEQINPKILQKVLFNHCVLNMCTFISMVLNTTTNFRVICQVISEKWPKKVIETFLLNADWERTPTLE